MRTLILAALAAFFMPAHADHSPEPGTFVPIPLMVCDTRDALDYVISVHEDAGEDGGAAAMNLMTETPSPMHDGEKLCGGVQGPWIIGETVRTAWLPFGGKVKWTVVTQVKNIRSGKSYFALLVSNDETRTPM